MSENLLKEICNKVLSLFKQTEKEEENAKDVACNRLRVVLMQDRTNLTPELLQRMRRELVELLSKYVEMDKEALIKLYQIANSKGIRSIMNVGDGRVVNKVKYADQEIKLDENINDFVYKNPVVQCTIADSDFDKIKNLIPIIEKIENVEIKNRIVFALFYFLYQYANFSFILLVLMFL